MVEGVSLLDIAQQYGTPFYCYSSASIIDAIMQYKNIFQASPLPVSIHYAVKANCRLAILNIMKANNIGLDIVSLGEMMAGQKAGFSTKDMIYSGVGKTYDDIAYAVNNHIGQLNVESFDEIDMLLDIVAKHPPHHPINVAVRVNPHIATGGHEKISTGKAGDKFGIDFDSALPAYQKLLSSAHLKPKMIAMHIGSQLTDKTLLKKAYQALAGLITQLYHANVQLTSIDIGGGMAIAYHDEVPLPLDDYAKLVMAIFAPLKKIGITDIIIEPGRSLVGRAGLLVTRVVLQKKSAGRHIVVVDTAMNDLIRPTLYHAYHPILPVKKPPETIDIKTQDIVGGICETGDFLALARKLPCFNNGDMLALFYVGAYGSAMASNYNSRLLPTEILIKGKEYFVIRPRQTYKNLFALENCL